MFGGDLDCSPRATPARWSSVGGVVDRRTSADRAPRRPSPPPPAAAAVHVGRSWWQPLREEFGRASGRSLRTRPAHPSAPAVVWGEGWCPCPAGAPPSLSLSVVCRTTSTPNERATPSCPLAASTAGLGAGQPPVQLASPPPPSTPTASAVHPAAPSPSAQDASCRELIGTLALEGTVRTPRLHPRSLRHAMCASSIWPYERRGL